MKIVKKVNQDEVWNHWKTIEGFTTNDFRSDIRNPLPEDLDWVLAMVEKEDIDSFFIISSDDWKQEGLCDPDFKLTTAITNYSSTPSSNGKYGDIRAKELLFSSGQNTLDTKLILVSPSKEGPFTFIEGNKRVIALGKLQKIVGLEFFFGISPSIKDYLWARYSHE